MSVWRLAGDELAALGDRIALEGQGAHVSYADFAARAASVWRGLRRAGVMPGAPAALVSSGRAHDEAVGLAGILTSGAVAVPLDATAPPRRLAAIMAARGCSAIVLDEKARPLADAIEAELGSGAQSPPARVILNASGAVISASGKLDPEAMDRSRRALGPVGSLACVLHTSGSTGVPKPVPITWAGLDAFTAWAIEQFSITSSDRVLRVAELIFDLAWFDHLATFRAGATLVTMSRRELAAGTATLASLRSLAPTVIYGVPSLFMKLSAALPEGGLLPIVLNPAPRVVLYAGEVFPPRELRAFADRVPGASIWNLYGPTETNVCTFHPIDRAALDGESETPIGSACPYARCSLIAEDGRVIEGPGTGELVVEGPTAVGGGPFATRDRVERAADGAFYFRGRIDRMIKIRGYRVEPGEVEAVIGAHPAVRQAAVLVHDDARIGKTLRAFVEIRVDATPPSERDFRIFLAERLPSYMVPERVSALADLPRTPTGKIDYRALAERPG